MNREEWEGAVCGGAFLSRISIARIKTFAMSSTPGYCKISLQTAAGHAQGGRSLLAQDESEPGQLAGRLMLDRAVSGMASDRYSRCCSLHALSRSLYHTAKAYPSFVVYNCTCV